MTENGPALTQTTAETGEISSAPAGPVPSQPLLLAEIQPPAPGEQLLDVPLLLSEIGMIAASLQTCVHAGWIREPSRLNLANSVLRKFHEAKLKLVETSSP